MNPLHRIKGDEDSNEFDMYLAAGSDDEDDEDEDIEPVLISKEDLRQLNNPQNKKLNLVNLETMGGTEGLLNGLDVNVKEGLRKDQILKMREIYGPNHNPKPVAQSVNSLLYKHSNDSLITILLYLGTSILVLGLILIDINEYLWIYGLFFIGVVLYLIVMQTIGDYSQQTMNCVEFGEMTTNVVRDDVIKEISVKDLVVGDILYLRCGDMVPTNAVVIEGSPDFYCDESSLTGESKEVHKSIHRRPDDDCFILPSSLITSSDLDVGIRAVVIAVGNSSQYTSLHNSLATTKVDASSVHVALASFYNSTIATGAVIAVIIFISLIIQKFHSTRGDYDRTEKRLWILSEICDSFTHAIAIIIIATPHFFAIALSITERKYQKMLLASNVFIKKTGDLAKLGCINYIIFDKTGTLTENSVEIVNGWFASVNLSTESKPDSWQNGSAVKDSSKIFKSKKAKALLVEHMSLNVSTYICKSGHFKDIRGTNRIDVSLVYLVTRWGYDPVMIKNSLFDENTDRVFPFEAVKKKSSTVICRKDGRVTVFCKGASEVVFEACSSFLDENGEMVSLTPQKRVELQSIISMFTQMGLRTIILTHRDFASINDLPANWRSTPPDYNGLCCDAILGIMDPIKEGARNSIEAIKSAGIEVCMVTGDDAHTACTVARQCSILTDGVAIEGKEFRELALTEVDRLLPRLQVMSRSSPEDKLLLTQRFNGRGLPAGQGEWYIRHGDRTGISWSTDRDKILPGYQSEWDTLHSGHGKCVCVTGDGSNDAPALKMADLGMAMGQGGTRVAIDAADAIVTNDKIDGVLEGILWGRLFHINIRIFIETHITMVITILAVNLVGGLFPNYTQYLSICHSLYVMMVVDTISCVALFTSRPDDMVTRSKPFTAKEALISPLMWQNIIMRSVVFTSTAVGLMASNVGSFNGEDNFHGSSKETLVLTFILFGGILHQMTSRIGDDRPISSYISGWSDSFCFCLTLATIVHVILVVNPGGYLPTSTTPLSLEEWASCLSLSAIGPFIDHLMRRMRPSKESRIAKENNEPSGTSTRLKSLRKRMTRENGNKGKTRKQNLTPKILSRNSSPSGNYTPPPDSPNARDSEQLI